MKALFAHGLKFYEDNKGNLYLRGYDCEYWNRYLKHFDELYIIGRKLKIKVDSLTGYDEFYKGDKIHFIEVPEIHSFFCYIQNISNTKALINKIVGIVDYVIARIPGTYSSIAVECAKNQKKPYLVEMVGCAWDALWNHSFKGKIVAPYRYYNTKKIVKDAKYVVYVTNEFLQKRYPTEGKYVNCSDVVLKEFDDNVLMNRLNKINTMKNNNKIVLGTIAAVDVRYKGQQYVIRALGKLKKQGITNYEYQLVGGGDQTYLKSVAEKYNVTEQVKFLGTIPHDKVFEWLDTIDIYVQPSSTEGLPRALIEAMSRGLPAFGSNVGGIPELLESQFIFSNRRKKVDEICNILLSFIKDTMKEQARRNYEEAKKYDKEIIEERRRKFFEKFIEENKKYKS